MWVAIKATTVVSVMLVSIYHSGPSLEAAWKYLVMGSVGIALALFGTMMTFYASGAGAGRRSDAGLTWLGSARRRHPARPGSHAARLCLQSFRRLRDRKLARADAHIAARRSQPGAFTDLRLYFPVFFSIAPCTQSCASASSRRAPRAPPNSSARLVLLV